MPMGMTLFVVNGMQAGLRRRGRRTVCQVDSSRELIEL